MISVSERPRPRAGLDLASEEKDDCGEREHDADDGERVAEGDDQRLTLDDLADRDDRLMLGRGGVGDPVRQEVVRQSAIR